MRPDLRRLRAGHDERCRKLLDAAAPLAVDDLDWSAVPATPLDPGVVACLVYMRDVEGFTDRDLAGLTAHRTTLADPTVRRFLAIWRAEEAGHTAALTRFLDAYGERPGAEVPPRQHPPAAGVAPLERVVARVGGPVGDVVAAAHMAWGAANELLTLHGYRLLARRCRHPVLQPLLTRIAAQEARHVAFYLLQAEWRLASSRPARFVLPRVLRGAWTPVGIGDGYKSPAEFGAVLRFLGADDRGREALARMDRRFAALPGFDGLRIYADAAARYADASTPTLSRPSVPAPAAVSAARSTRIVPSPAASPAMPSAASGVSGSPNGA